MSSARGWSRWEPACLRLLLPRPLQDRGTQAITGYVKARSGSAGQRSTSSVDSEPASSAMRSSSLSMAAPMLPRPRLFVTVSNSCAGGSAENTL